MSEEQIRESNKLYQTGEYTLKELALKYSVSIGKIRYGWKKLELPIKLSKEGNSKSKSIAALKRNNEEANRKRKQTNLQRYGVSNVSLLEEVSQKKRDSMSNKWDEIKQHRKDSTLEKYGVDNVMKVPEIRDKQLATMERQYGTIYPRRAAIKNGGLLENKNFIKEWAVNFKTENKRKPSPMELSNYLSFKSPNGTYKAIHIFNLEDYFLWRMTPLEELFENQIKELGVKYEHNNRTVIAPLEIDFWFPEQKIGIEINDVASHNSDTPFLRNGIVKASNYHQEKVKKAIDMNIRLIHLYEWELYDEKIMNYIKKILIGSKEKIYARQTLVKEISPQEANSFIEEYHLQGKCAGNLINLGLFYKNNLVSVMTFGKPRHSTNYDWELLRYCSSTEVIGGASKLFKHFLNQIPKGSTIISFQNLDKFSGNLYEQLGFEFDGYTAPSYEWVKRNNIFERYSWFLITKKGVDNILGTHYGKGKNNVELMKKEGFVRVYNSGNRRYIYKT